jgi:hypothetical protein
MNYSLKLLGKEEIKYFKTVKESNNPPKKIIEKPKSLLIELPKKTNKRKFGNDLQNLGQLTDQNNLSFNHKKRKRNKDEKIPSSKELNENNPKNFCSKKIFNIMHNNINSNSDKDITKTDTINELDENKENIQNLNTQNNINIENKNININPKNINLIRISITKSNCENNIININSIKKNEKEKNKSINKEKKDKTSSTKKNLETKKEIKIIKVNIFPLTDLIYENNKKIRYNLQRAKEYLEEIHEYMKSIESNGIALSNYMSLIQTDINEKMRIILINWLIEVHFKFHLLNETLFICINIIDRYLSQKNINRKYLQLLGITSLFIASKYEEIYAPSAKDLIFMTDNAYKIEEMIKMENEILRVLKFELTFPTSLRFLELYGDFLNLDEINLFRCYYLNEVSLICYNLCGFCPSLIACACLYINLKSNILVFKGYNEEELFKITGYKKTEISNCLKVLINALVKMDEPNNKFISIKKKYALDKYKKVSIERYMIGTE